MVDILFSNCLSQSLVACCHPLCFVGLPPWTQQLGKSIQCAPVWNCEESKIHGFVVNYASLYSFRFDFCFICLSSAKAFLTHYKKYLASQRQLAFKLKLHIHLCKTEEEEEEKNHFNDYFIFSYCLCLHYSMAMAMLRYNNMWYGLILNCCYHHHK